MAATSERIAAKITAAKAELPETVVTAALVDDLWKWSEDILSEARALTHRCSFLAADLEESLRLSRAVQSDFGAGNIYTFKFSESSIDDTLWLMSEIYSSAHRLKDKIEPQADVLGNVEMPLRPARAEVKEAKPLPEVLDAIFVIDESSNALDRIEAMRHMVYSALKDDEVTLGAFERVLDDIGNIIHGFKREAEAVRRPAKGRAA